MYSLLRSAYDTYFVANVRSTPFLYGIGVRSALVMVPLLHLSPLHMQ